MEIGQLLRNEIQTLELHETYLLSPEIYGSTEIIELNPVQVEGILKIIETNIFMKANISGSMIIPDSVSLEPVEYHFSFEIDENVQEKIKKDENTLDIMAILWENIVLEIPIRYSEVKDYKNFSGDGWNLIDEETYQKKEKNNPFKDLLEEFGEE